jgi:hypothetical protein
LSPYDTRVHLRRIPIAAVVYPLPTFLLIGTWIASVRIPDIDLASIPPDAWRLALDDHVISLFHTGGTRPIPASSAGSGTVLTYGPRLITKEHLFGLLETGRGSSQRGVFEVSFDVWSIPIASFVFLSLPLLILSTHSMIRHRRNLIGQCPTCGYDLRASPTRCPECGTPLVQSSPAA